MWMMLCFLRGAPRAAAHPLSQSLTLLANQPSLPVSGGRKTAELSSELASCKPLGTQSSGIESKAETEGSFEGEVASKEPSADEPTSEKSSGCVAS